MDDVVTLGKTSRIDTMLTPATLLFVYVLNLSLLVSYDRTILLSYEMEHSMGRPRHHQNGSRRLTILLTAEDAALLDAVRARYMEEYGVAITSSRALSFALGVAQADILQVSPEATTLGVLAGQLRRLRTELNKATRSGQIRPVLTNSRSVLANLADVQRKIKMRHKPGKGKSPDSSEARKLETAVEELITDAERQLVALAAA